MNLKARKMAGFSFLLCIAVMGGILFFYQYMKKEPQITSRAPSTEQGKLLEKDIEDGYPSTPKEVIKEYCRYMQCIYKNELTQNELEKMVDKVQLFYAKDFLAVNPKQQQLTKLQSEIKNFSSNHRTIVNYSVENNGDVKYENIQGKNCALVATSFLMTEKKGYSKSFQNYILVKESEKWKIIGFKQIKSTSQQSGSEEAKSND
jgi:hypothetical protein